MAKNKKIATNAFMLPQEKQEQKKRIIWVLAIGILSLLVFYYLAGGLVSLMMHSTTTGPTKVEQPHG